MKRNWLRNNLIVFSLAFSVSACQDDKGNSSSPPENSVPTDVVSEAPGYSYPPLPPSTPQALVLDSNCLENTTGEFCALNYNPILQNSGPFSGNRDNVTELQNLQQFKVQIKATGPRGELANANFMIIPVGTPSTLSTDRNWNIRLTPNEFAKFLEVNAYFWLDFAVNRSFALFGSFYAHNKAIRVFINDQFSGWSSSLNSIHLDQSESVYPAALDPSLIVHFLGLANLHHATNGSLGLFIRSTKHRACGEPNEKGRKNCCASAAGCSLAIASGSADYFQATVLGENNTTIGGTYRNESEGISHCSVARNLDINRNLSLSEAFSACESKEASGYVPILGLVYASIWWNLRGSIPRANTDAIHPVDKLFQEHLSQINSEDDFSSIYKKIIDLDDKLFTGAHRDLLRAEFERRGVSVD